MFCIGGTKRTYTESITWLIRNIRINIDDDKISAHFDAIFYFSQIFYFFRTCTLKLSEVGAGGCY